MNARERGAAADKHQEHRSLTFRWSGGQRQRAGGQNAAWPQPQPVTEPTLFTFHRGRGTRGAQVTFAFIVRPPELPHQRC